MVVLKLYSYIVSRPLLNLSLSLTEPTTAAASVEKQFIHYTPGRGKIVPGK